MICAWEAAGRSEGTAGENRPPVAQPQTTRGGGARLQEASALSQDRLLKHACPRRSFQLPKNALRPLDWHMWA